MLKTNILFVNKEQKTKYCRCSLKSRNVIFEVTNKMRNVMTDIIENKF